MAVCLALVLTRGRLLQTTQPRAPLCVAWLIEIGGTPMSSCPRWGSHWAQRSDIQRFDLLARIQREQWRICRESREAPRQVRAWSGQQMPSLHTRASWRHALRHNRFYIDMLYSFSSGIVHIAINLIRSVKFICCRCVSVSCVHMRARATSSRLHGNSNKTCLSRRCTADINNNPSHVIAPLLSLISKNLWAFKIFIDICTYMYM